MVSNGISIVAIRRFVFPIGDQEPVGIRGNRSQARSELTGNWLVQSFGGKYTVEQTCSKESTSPSRRENGLPLSNPTVVGADGR